MSESTENYLKTIFTLQKKLGGVRSIDVARELNVSKPSVSNAVKKLQKKGFVNVDTSHNLILTKDGLNYATSIFEQHILIERYLIEILKVDEKTAHRDSCRMEHWLSKETLNKIKESYEKCNNTKIDMNYK